MPQPNRSKQNQRKTNTLVLEIVKISERIGFESNTIVSCFQNKKNPISSSDFTLDRFNTKRKFVNYINEFCQKQNSIKIGVGKLVKLWDALSSIYNISRNSPCYPMSKKWAQSIIKDDEKSLVFISKKSTQSIIKNELIQEPFRTTQRLYQYLNWTIRINKINQFIHFFKTSNNITIMIINSELHNKNGEILYILCIKNDVTTTKAQKWQFVQLLTEKQIKEFTTYTSKKTELLIAGFIRMCLGSVSSVGSVCSVSDVPSHIQSLINAYNPADLPGARHTSFQFKRWRENTLITKEQIARSDIKRSRYQQLKSVQTGHDKRRKDTNEILQVELDAFYDHVNEALNSNDIRNNLIPIVSILTGKRYNNNNKNGDYSVDQILPVRINNNWIGVIYRNGSPMSTLIDKYDIINKAILCDPTFDKSTLDYFVNYICKIEIGDNMTSLGHDSGNTSMVPVYETNGDIYGMQSPPVYEGNNTTTNDTMFAYNINNVSMDGYVTTTTTAPATNVNANDNVAGNYKFAPSNGTIINGTSFTPTSTLPAINEGYETKQQVLVTAASTPITPTLGTLPSMTNSQPMVYGNTTNNIINYNNLNVMNCQPLMTNTIGNVMTVPVQNSQPIGGVVPNNLNVTIVNGIAVPTILPTYPKIYKISPIINLPANFQMSNYILLNGIIHEEITISVQSSVAQSIIAQSIIAQSIIAQHIVTK